MQAASVLLLGVGKCLPLLGRFGERVSPPIQNARESATGGLVGPVGNSEKGSAPVEEELLLCLG